LSVRVGNIAHALGRLAANVSAAVAQLRRAVGKCGPLFVAGNARKVLGHKAFASQRRANLSLLQPEGQW
jgi:hypothetical protein